MCHQCQERVGDYNREDGEVDGGEVEELSSVLRSSLFVLVLLLFKVRQE